MSELYLLKEPIVNEEDFYVSFLRGSLEEEGYFSNQKVEIPDVEEFIFYIGSGRQEERKEIFKKLIKLMMHSFVDMKQEVFLSQNFWLSYISSKLRTSVIKNHPKIQESFSEFKLIVLRDLDWENYLYRAAIYGSILHDRVADSEELDEYIDVINENMDVFNYILKKRVFRNDQFIFNMLQLLRRYTGTELIQFLKFRDQTVMGRDVSPGRLLLTEMNTAYPTVLFPMLDYESFEDLFFQYLNHNEKIYELKVIYDKKKKGSEK